jgi:hypothetical protein
VETGTGVGGILVLAEEDMAANRESSGLECATQRGSLGIPVYPDTAQVRSHGSFQRLQQWRFQITATLFGGPVYATSQGMLQCPTAVASPGWYRAELHWLRTRLLFIAFATAPRSHTLQPVALALVANLIIGVSSSHALDHSTIFRLTALLLDFRRRISLPLQHWRRGWLGW